MKKRRPAPRARRVRRSPEAAQELLLDAADTIFARSMPDEVGLKEIARQAGVSHGLVTHYFGTYERLVETCLVRRLRRSREVALERFVRGSFDGSEFPFIDAALESVRDPTMVRLLTWSMLTGRADRADYLPVTANGLGLIVDAIQTRFAAATQVIPRARIEHAVMMTLAAVFGLALTGPRTHQALGRGSADTFDIRNMRAELGAMLQAYLRG